MSNSDTKHTPGPWRYDKDNLNVYANGMLAQTYGHSHNGEREANARLIAACPEMLAALHAALYALEMNHHLVTNAEERMISVKGQSAVVKAIAKAEGRSE